MMLLLFCESKCPNVRWHLLTTIVMGLLLSLKTSAQEGFPAGCTTVPLQVNHDQLRASAPRVFLLNNVSSNDIWITYQFQQAGLSAGLTSRLQAQHWSALVLAGDVFALACVTSMPGHERRIACHEVLKACQWPGMHIPTSANGNFWAAEDSPLNSLVEALGHRGFISESVTEKSK